MTRPPLRTIVPSLAMLLASAVAVALTPRERMADQVHSRSLDELIPRTFGDWRIDPAIIPVEVSPDVKAQLERFYSETISRTYVNDAGERVMLSLAYGDTQSRTLQVHRPEVCYVAQGFSVGALLRASMHTAATEIPVVRLVARHGSRTEPITYWIRFGDQIVEGHLDQSLARIAYGLSGRIADGLLVRVSTISVDPERAYQVHAAFIEALVRALPEDERWRLVGRIP
jgi:EpsI family protein